MLSLINGSASECRPRLERLLSDKAKSGVHDCKGGSSRTSRKCHNAVELRVLDDGGNPVV